MKRFLSVILSIVLILQVFYISAFTVNDSGSPKHIPRIVSVVFDDSGSMYKETDRWAYTSYAMQAFCAMMGDEDVLYLTYLNSSDKSLRLNLSKSGKQVTIDKIENTMFGGGTPNKLQKGADCLTKEYSSYKTNAKYYLVVMADGSLDKGDMSAELETVTLSTRQKLSGVDFESIYFSMKGELGINGVTCKSASSGDEIVNVLRDISADIMGRTKVNCSGAGGKITFDLKYPALSIAVFGQKTNGEFKNINVPIARNGKSALLETNTYYLDCPLEVNKNPDKQIFTEKKPSTPPSGFVSLITNGNNSVPKGTYTIDLSAYGISNENVIILVEPAVRIDCKYSIKGSNEEISFDELKNKVRTGDKVIVKCGLYEINSDGSSGEAVPLDVLSPEYKLYLNGVSAGKKVSGEVDTYEIDITEKIANNELKIEAILKGYQPFVLREKFGSIKIDPSSAIPEGDERNIITLTKPEWKNWVDGKGEVLFPLTYVDSSMLSEISVKINGADFLPEGKCSELGNITIKGNTVVYNPAPSKPVSFDKVPGTFSVSLIDNVDNNPIATVTVNSVQPAYKIEAVNELEGTVLGLEMLKTNTKGIKFVLTADYNGNGTYTPVKDSNCESDIKFALSQGGLTGTIKEETGEICFVPVYNVESNTDVSPADILGKDHIISALATVDGVEVKSEEILLSASNVAYKITVDNQIKEPLTLDTVKNNKKKIVFTLLADYVGNGEYGLVEEWDYAIFEKLNVKSGDLPGTIKKELDSNGKTVGISFIPDYDENNNKGIVFTKVSGKIHNITAELAGYDAVAETTVEVLAPKYEIKVKKEGLVLVDADIWKNDEGVEFIVLRNDRPLTKEELEGFAPYQLSYSVEQKWLSVEGQAEDGYILCKPTYNGWKFISPRLWGCMSLLMIKKGDMSVILTVGENTADADIHIDMSLRLLIILLVVLGVILLICWIVFCYFSQIKFSRGSFYKVTLKKQLNRPGYTFSNVSRISATKGVFKKFIFSKNLLIPFGLQTKKITFNQNPAVFETRKFSGVRRTFPYSSATNKANFNRGRLPARRIEELITRNKEFSIDEATIKGSACGEKAFKMYKGVFLVENAPNAKVIVFYLSKKEERKIKARASKNKKLLPKEKSGYQPRKRSKSQP